MKPVFYIPIEVSRRGFNPSILLTKWAMQAGFDVVVISKYWFEQYCLHSLLPPGVVYVKDLTHRSFQQGMSQALDDGFLVICKMAECLDKKSSLFSDPMVYEPYLKRVHALLATTKAEKNLYVRTYANKGLSTHNILDFHDPRVAILEDASLPIYSTHLQSLQCLYGDFDTFSISARPVRPDHDQLRLRTYRFFEGHDLISPTQIESYISYRIALGEYYSRVSLEAKHALYEIIAKTESDYFLLSTHPGGKANAINDYQDLYTSNIRAEFTSCGSFEPKLIGSLNYYSGLCTTSVLASFTGISASATILGNTEDPMQEHVLYHDVKNGRLLQSLSNSARTVNVLLDLRESNPPVEPVSLRTTLSTSIRFPVSWKFQPFTKKVAFAFNNALNSMLSTRSMVELLSDVAIFISNEDPQPG